MTEEQKMIWMFEQANGVLDTRTGCSFVTDNYPPTELILMKDGNECWSKSKAELVFDYLTREL